jgi:hypothetical protein
MCAQQRSTETLSKRSLPSNITGAHGTRVGVIRLSL